MSLLRRSLSDRRSSSGKRTLIRAYLFASFNVYVNGRAGRPGRAWPVVGRGATRGPSQEFPPDPRIRRCRFSHHPDGEGRRIRTRHGSGGAGAGARVSVGIRGGHRGGGHTTPGCRSCEADRDRQPVGPGRLRPRGGARTHSDDIGVGRARATGRGGREGGPARPVSRRDRHGHGPLGLRSVASRGVGSGVGGAPQRSLGLGGQLHALPLGRC